jgi:hypothetical protein
VDASDRTHLCGRNFPEGGLLGPRARTVVTRVLVVIPVALVATSGDSGTPMVVMGLRMTALVVPESRRAGPGAGGGRCGSRSPVGGSTSYSSHPLVLAARRGYGPCRDECRQAPTGTASGTTTADGAAVAGARVRADRSRSYEIRGCRHPYR